MLPGDGVGTGGGRQGQDRVAAGGIADAAAVQGQGPGGLVVEVGADIAGLHDIAEGQGIAAGAGEVHRIAIHQTGFQQQGRYTARGVDDHRLVEGEGDVDDIAHLVGAIRVGHGDTGDHRVDRVDGDCQGVAVQLRPATAGIAQVAGAELDGGRTIEAGGGGELQAVEGGVDVRQGAGEHQDAVGDTVTSDEAEAALAAQGDQAIAGGQADLQVAGARVHIGDADEVAVAGIEHQAAVLGDVLARRQAVHRRIVHRSHRQGDAGVVAQRPAAADVATVVDADAEGDVAVGVGATGEAQAVGGDEGVDVGDGAREGQAGAARAGHGDTGTAEGTEGAAGDAEARDHAAAARIHIAEGDAGERLGEVLGDGDAARSGDDRCIVHRHHRDTGRDGGRGAVHAAVAGATAVTNTGQGQGTGALAGDLATVAVGHAVHHALGGGGGETGAGQGDGGGAAHQAHAVADAIDRSGAAGAVHQGDLGAVDAEDLAGAIDQAADAEGQPRDALARFHRAQADAAEQVDGAAILGVGGIAATGAGGGGIVHRDQGDQGTAAGRGALPVGEGPVEGDAGPRILGTVGVGQLLQDLVHIRRARRLAVGMGEGQGQLAGNGSVEAADHLAILHQVAAHQADAVAVEEAEQVVGVGASIAHQHHRCPVVIAVTTVEGVQVGIRHAGIAIDHDGRTTLGEAAAAVEVAQHRCGVGLHRADIHGTRDPAGAIGIDGQRFAGVAVAVQVEAVQRQVGIAAGLQQGATDLRLVGLDGAAVVEGEIAQQQAAGALVVQAAVVRGEGDAGTEVAVGGCLHGSAHIVGAAPRCQG
ncbi:PE-PGRS family protein [Metapseudomonas furukawaii]|nr:PE-PGRS family protein [Pseudomonas furukawaii]